MSIIISSNGQKAVRVDKSSIEKEDFLQQYIYENPESIPLYEIKEDIQLLILAREFPTNSGPIDAIGIDKYGELYIVETKLFANADKRKVIAQSLDYGAALWKHANDFNEFVGILDAHTRRIFNLSVTDKIAEFFNLDLEAVDGILERAKENLNNGIFHFVVLMDKLDDRLKDLILYVNQNSQFDIYAVELEYYQHETYEIIIPKIFGAEVKKDLKVNTSEKKEWNWDLFKQRLAEFGEVEVVAAEKILSWASENDIAINWSTSKRGGFFLSFDSKSKKGFFPFVINGDAKVTWNAPHQGDKSPTPFDAIEMRTEILKQLQSIEGAEVDLTNVDGYNGFKLPLKALIDENTRLTFFSVCTWIKEQMKV